jgi:hypothetical protein
MPERPLHSCAQPGCSNAAPGGQPYCVSCQARRPKETRYPQDKKYNTADWRKTSANVRRYNPICQLLDDTGKQCTNPSAVVHHLRDPKDAPELFLDWHNLVAICEEHHGHTRGETLGRRFCHTIGFNRVFEHGCLYPNNHPDYKPQEAAILVGGTYSAVSKSAIQKALEEPI